MLFKVSNIKEREDFYKNEFNLNKAKEWFKKNKLLMPQLYAIDMGSETKIIKNKEKLNKIINLRPDNLKNKLVRYAPEDVYYDRNRYKEPELMLRKLNFREIFNDKNFLGQQLAFDIDPENFKCKCKSKFPKFCEKCMKKSIKQSIELANFLEKSFKNIGLVYSGRGMHVHVFDKEAFKLSVKEREVLNKKLKKFNIDKWVSRGYIRLIRLPYSLNALVSRIVVPLSIDEAKDFNPVNDRRVMPGFLK